MKRDALGVFSVGEPEYPNGKPLYRLQDLAARVDEAVVVCEGEWCADALVGAGVLATTSGSADSAAKADWSPLAGRTVMVWPDNDEAGWRYAEAVKAVLAPIARTVSVLDPATLGLAAKGDAVDWLRDHPGATAADIFALPRVEATGPTSAPEAVLLADDEDDTKEGRRSQASELVDFVVAHADLFHDQNKDVYAQDRATHETRRLDSRQFKDWLVAAFYKSTQKSPRDQSVREALSTLSGLGRHEGECLDVHVRVALLQGAYYLDLAESGASRAVRISAGAWEVVDRPDVRFIRPEALRPLPEPVRGGAIDALWRLVNVPVEARLLVLAWLGECMRPDTPFPVLELIGEQGSAKSTTQSVLRRLIDPNACDLRGAPKTAEDVYISAGVNWLVSYENISHLAGGMQDALCVLATGGGFAKRKLYSDSDEAVINVKRPVVLNGISAAITAQDLVDRTVSIETPVITARTEGTELWGLFESAQAQLLGALLDAVAGALARLPTVHIAAADRPRLVEFARFGMAMADALGRPAAEFMAQFNASRQEAIARTIDASPVATALIDWFDARDRRPATMAAKELFAQVEKKRPPHAEAWPHTAKGFADAMRRAAPALRQMGIECRCEGKSRGNVQWSVRPREKPPEPSPSSPACPQNSGSRDIGTSRTLAAAAAAPEPDWEDFR